MSEGRGKAWSKGRQVQGRSHTQGINQSTQGSQAGKVPRKGNVVNKARARVHKATWAWWGLGKAREGKAGRWHCKAQEGTRLQGGGRSQGGGKAEGHKEGRMVKAQVREGTYKLIPHRRWQLQGEGNCRLNTQGQYMYRQAGGRQRSKHVCKVRSKVNNKVWREAITTCRQSC